MVEASLRLAAVGLMLLLADVATAAEPADALQSTILPFEDGALEVTFHAVDLATGHRWTVAPEGVDVRRPPFSTFKIPNLLIALDTGVAKSLDHAIDWNPERRPAADFWPSEWAERQTLASAFRRSAVWYFRDLALAIGGPIYRDRLSAFGYGNGKAPDGSDLFWLDGTLSISPREQTAFLVELVQGRLPVQPAHLDALREVARLGERDGRGLYGKTGAGPLDPDDFEGPFRGWLVGWVERPDAAPVVFALFVDGPDWSSIARFRREAAEQLLTEMGVWPAA